MNSAVAEEQDQLQSQPAATVQAAPEQNYNNESSKGASASDDYENDEFEAMEPEDGTKAADQNGSCAGDLSGSKEHLLV